MAKVIKIENKSIKMRDKPCSTGLHTTAPDMVVLRYKALAARASGDIHRSSNSPLCGP